MKLQKQWEQNKHNYFESVNSRIVTALVSGITVTTIALVGYTAMAGVVGVGGLGTLAYLEGFQRGNNDVTIVATICVLLVVFLIQWIGDSLTTRIDKR